tara:strand:+ start:1953 stop:2450 length:498 start_codon:yes stop_codon:yes gene_type:complete
MEPPNDIENPSIGRPNLHHSPARSDDGWGQFTTGSPEEKPKPKNFPRKPSSRLSRVLDLNTGDSNEDFNVYTPPQNMYHPVPVKEPLPNNTDVEELKQALAEGVAVVKESICNSVSGCQLQGGRKRKRKRRTRKKKRKKKIKKKSRRKSRKTKKKRRKSRKKRKY